MTRPEWQRRHVAMHAKLSARPSRIAACHPAREHAARGMCEPCYRRYLAAQHRMARATA